MKKHMNTAKKIMICLMLLVRAVAGNAQGITDITGSFDNFRSHALQEKLFVHTDKINYLAGELLWLKIYAVAGETNKPLNLSKVAYVDVIDKNQNSVLQAKIALTTGSGSGSLYIPVTLSSGNYRLRAYTSWMKNFSPEYYFERKITIINSLRFTEAAPKAEKSNIDLQFFPEGGNLVAGLPAKVAFKISGTDGKGLNYKGAVIDEHHDTIVRFQPLKFGIGSFLLTPGSNHTYSAVVFTAEGQVTRALPLISPQGYVMSLRAIEHGELDITVRSNQSNSGQVYLFAHTRQVVKAAKAALLNNGEAHFLIDTALLGDGISHITVFDAGRQPICERLYFKRPAPGLHIDASTNMQAYGQRARVSVSLAAKNTSGGPVKANLSVSVYLDDIMQGDDVASIRGYLWLSSDLRGYIESPDYYFSENTAAVNEAVDNLMLSQGWRRFDWKKVLNNQTPAFDFLPEYEGHVITAKITNAKTNSPVSNVIAYLGVTGKRVQLSTASSDTAGRLIFNTTNLFGPGEIVVQTNTQADSTLHIEVSNPFSEQFAKNTLPPFITFAAMQKPLEKLNLGIQVQNIYSGDQIRRFYETDVDTSAFYGNYFKLYKLDDYTRYATMEEVMREYVKNVNVTHTDNKFHLNVLSKGIFFDNGPLIMVDGIPLFNTDKLFAIDPLKVRKLEVVADRYFWQATQFEGILSFTTYKGDLGGVEIDPKAVILDYEGLQLQREFYSPRYDENTEDKKRLPDWRSTLYWSPDVALQDNGTAELSFYTGDVTGRYKVVIQGISPDGNAGSKLLTFEVKSDRTAEIKR